MTQYEALARLINKARIDGKISLTDNDTKTLVYYLLENNIMLNAKEEAKKAPKQTT